MATKEVARGSREDHRSGRRLVRELAPRGQGSPGRALLGTQWGDEGKGKVTHLMADAMDMVVRYQGGNNAGHTVIVGTETFKLHLLPAGILYPHITPVLAPGVVVDPSVLLEEVDALALRGISAEKLRISGNAHLIMPY